MDERTRSRFKLTPEAIVMITLAAIAIGATNVTFRTHVTDFEETVEAELVELKARLVEVEHREREDGKVLTRVDTEIAHLREDMKLLKRQMGQVLDRLPTRGDSQ